MPDMKKRIKFFMDTEFIERGAGRPIELISIGMISEQGHTFYAVSSEFDADSANDWVKANVLPHLNVDKEMRLTLAEIASEVQSFVDECGAFGGVKPEFWGYYADYDWVVFCQMFGAMVSLPKGWPMYCRDIKQLCDSIGNPELPKQDSTEHNALNDSKWNKKAHEFLMALIASPEPPGSVAGDEYDVAAREWWERMYPLSCDPHTAEQAEENIRRLAGHFRAACGGRELELEKALRWAVSVMKITAEARYGSLPGPRYRCDWCTSEMEKSPENIKHKPDCKYAAALTLAAARAKQEKEHDAKRQG